MRKSYRHILVGSAGIGIYLLLSYLLFITEKGDESSNIKSYADAVWYGLVTLTTVGYGDFYPTTLYGKLVGMFFILGSLGVLGYLISQLSNAYSNYMEKKKYGQFGTDFTGHYVLIGWNSFAKLVATEIYNSEKQLAIVTNKKEKVDSIQATFSEQNTFVLLNEYDQFANYNKVNIEQAESIFVNFEDDTKTLVFLINLRKRFKNLPKIVVALDNADLKDTYHQIGIDCTIATQDVASKLVASYIFEPEVATYTEDLIQTSIEENDCDIIQHCVKADSPVCNQNYFDMFVKLKRDFNVVLIGLSRHENGQTQLLKNPNQEERIKENDCLIMINDKIGKEKIVQYLKNTSAK